MYQYCDIFITEGWWLSEIEMRNMICKDSLAVTKSYQDIRLL